MIQLTRRRQPAPRTPAYWVSSVLSGLPRASSSIEASAVFRLHCPKIPRRWGPRKGGEALSGDGPNRAEAVIILNGSPRWQHGIGCQGAVVDRKAAVGTFGRALLCLASVFSIDFLLSADTIT